MYSAGQLGEPGGDSQHLVSRRKPVYTSGKDKYLERGVKKEGQRWSQMWFNIPTEKETDKEAHRGEKSLMPDPSLELSLHAFIVENVDTSKGTIET